MFCCGKGSMLFSGSEEAIQEGEKKKKRTNKKFSVEEDQKLKKLVQEFGEFAWEEISLRMRGRNVRQCHDRWVYYLSPKVSTAPWTDEEDQRLIKLAQKLNGKWVQIAKRFKGRNDTQIKNRWNILKKKMNLPVINRHCKTKNNESQSSPPEMEEPTDDVPKTGLFAESFLDKFTSIFQDHELSEFSNDFLFLQ